MKRKSKSIIYILFIILLCVGFNKTSFAENEKIWIYNNEFTETISIDKEKNFKVDIDLSNGFIDEEIIIKLPEEIKYIPNKNNEQFIETEDNTNNIRVVRKNSDIELITLELEVTSIGEYNILAESTNEQRKIPSLKISVKAEAEDEDNRLLNYSILRSNLRATAPPTSDFNVLDYFVVPNLGSATNAAYPDNTYKNMVTLTNDEKEKFGVMWGKPVISLEEDFEIEGHVYLYSENDSQHPADGLTFTIHGDPKQHKAYGTKGWGLGVYGYTDSGSPAYGPTPLISNALTFEMDSYWNSSYSERELPIGGNGTQEGGDYPGHIAVVETNLHAKKPISILARGYGEILHQKAQVANVLDPLARDSWRKFEFQWIAATKTAVYKLEGFNEIHYTIEDLNKTFGGSDVIFGFTASTGDKRAYHKVAFTKLPGAPVNIYYKDINTKEDIEPYLEKIGDINEPWTSEKKDIEGYKFVEVEGETEGVFTSKEQIVTYYYTKVSEIDILKKDMENNLLKGAKFNLSGNEYNVTLPLDGEPIDTFVFKDLLPGEYILTEVEEPDGYRKIENSISIVISSNGDITVNNSEENITITENIKHKLSLDIKNEKKMEPFSFYKIDEKGNSMEGVEFTLYECLNQDSSHTHLEFKGEAVTGCWQKKLDTISESDGLVSFGNLKDGKYLLVETSTLNGYELPTGYWEINIDSSKENIEERIKIIARGSKLPPAFKINHETNELSLPNYPVIILPKSGNLELIITTILGIVTIGSGFLYFIASEKQKKQIKNYKK
ncbi:lectin-like domain-containing protein [Miniphocaeibacter massiliensis]|uniref:lectin-like domain-containing protein n=1 Tax=Miniphocaeibacter massiliensis TaxID=2041841 RepID=UPI000C1C6E96|nr:SpaA isopeptide-forming pilin-related protein [Miniphocaeibacter massiliensis]